MRYEEDEVNTCCICQRDGEPWYDNDKNLIYYDGDYYCEDCLFDLIYNLERGVNFIMLEGLEDEFEAMAYKERFYDLIRWDFDETRDWDVEDFIKENLEDFAHWLEERPAISTLQELHNILMTEREKQQLSAKHDRKDEK